MSAVIEYLKAARAAAAESYEQKIVDEAIASIQAHECAIRAESPQPISDNAPVLQVLCMTPCSRCDRIKPYLPSAKALCGQKGVKYEYHNDNSYLIKMKKQYKPMSGGTPVLLLVNADGSYRTASPCAAEIATESAFLEFVARFIG